MGGLRQGHATRARRAAQRVVARPQRGVQVRMQRRRDIELDALMKFRGQLNKELEARGVKLSVNDFIIKACALALQAVPDCNAVWAGDRVLRFKASDVAVAQEIERATKQLALEFPNLHFLRVYSVASGTLDSGASVEAATSSPFAALAALLKPKTGSDRDD